MTRHALRWVSLCDRGDQGDRGEAFLTLAEYCNVKRTEGAQSEKGDGFSCIKLARGFSQP